LLKRWKALLLIVGIVAAMFTYLELPRIDYCEPTDFPAVVAIKLDAKIKHSNLLQPTQPFPIMRCWGWRWGRCGAYIQVWGIDSQWQQDAIVRYVLQAKEETGSHRFIRIEFMHGQPGATNCYSIGETQV